MFGTKESKSKSDHQIHETLTPLSDLNGTTKAPPEKGSIAVSRVPTSPSAITPRDVKNDLRAESKGLLVGRGISLNGKIGSCDRLVIGGSVEAELENCHTVEVTEGGTFKGTAEIAVAEISGQYEGSLTARESLLIRGTGRVSGTIRYGRLRIEEGGEINGEFKKISMTP